MVVSTNMNTAVGVTLYGIDPEGSMLTYVVVKVPEHGSLTGTVPALTYTPDNDYVGLDYFWYTANDGSLTSIPAQVSLYVNYVAPTATPVPTPIPTPTLTPTPTPVPAPTEEPANGVTTENSLTNWWWLLLLILIAAAGLVVYYYGYVKK
jgi:hypothetical protein